MLDLKFIRENTDLVRKAIADRKDNAPLDQIMVLDEEQSEIGMDSGATSKARWPESFDSPA